jgi:hypothetical protein
VHAATAASGEVPAATATHVSAAATHMRATTAARVSAAATVLGEARARGCHQQGQRRGASQKS